MSTRCHFVTFGGSGSWPSAARRLTDQAMKCDLFATVTCMTECELFPTVPALHHFRDFICNNERGFGYWIWKPALVASVMDKVSQGDIVFYLDAGFELPPLGRSHLAKMIKFAEKNGAMILDYKRYPIFNCIFWTKADLWEEPELSSLRLESRPGVPLSSAGAFALRVVSANRRFVEDWFALATRNGCHLVDDTPSSIPQATLFFEHRHDQSIFSLLKAVRGLPSYGDALDFDFTDPKLLLDWPSLARRPFLALRNRTGQSMIPSTEAITPSVTARSSIGWLKWHIGLRPRGATERNAVSLTQQNEKVLKNLGLL